MKPIEFVRVRGLKPVCIGVERTLEPGKTALIDADEAKFLVLAGQVEYAEPLEQPKAAEQVAA